MKTFDRRARGWPARVVAHFTAICLLCASSFSASAAVSPFAPIRIGARPDVPAVASVTVPLQIPASQLDALFGPTVLFDSADPVVIAAFALAGVTLPVTVSSLVAAAPGAVINLGALTATLNGAPEFTLDLGDCAAPVGATCTMQAQFLAAVPGTYTAQVLVDPPPVTITNGGVFGALITSLYPFTSGLLANFLVFDVIALAGAANPVPADHPLALALLAMAMMAAGSWKRRRAIAG